MSSGPRVFVVTGANKGIGKSIVKLLLQDKEEKIVYLTSRNAELGKKAVAEFESAGMHPLYHQLDITDRKSAEALRDHLVTKHSGLDVLVNNAGMAFQEASTAPFSEKAEVTVRSNFFGTLQVCEVLFPILRNNARVAHVSSMSSEGAYRRLSGSLKGKFEDPNLSIEGLKSLLSKFIADAQEDKVEANGWPKNAYGMSKVGVTVMTMLQQKEFDKNPERNILVNSCCPGLVDTDLTGGKYSGMITPDEGADTPSYLALLPQHATVPKGCFLKLRQIQKFPPS